MTSPEGTTFDFRNGLAKPESFSSGGKPQVTLWVSLTILTMLLFLTVSLPAVEAKEPVLTGSNLLSLLNQDRQKNGLSPLQGNPMLERAAYAKARDILANNYFAHTSPAGITPWDFIKNEGFIYKFAGENLAINYSSAYDLENDFLKSPSHRDNLLSPLFSEVGIAVVSGISNGQPAIVTVQMFGSPATANLAQN